MNINEGTAGASEDLLESFAAELTAVAYSLAIERAMGEHWLAFELDLWKAIAQTVHRSSQVAKHFGPYRLGRRLGSGGMGAVYLAEHRMMKRLCAIKLIRPCEQVDPHALAQFEREVRATANLSHPNTIEIFDYGRAEDGTFYYAMEYLSGLSLADLVEKHGPLPPARAIYLLTQVCGCLAEAHSNGLIHRDVKPGNIFSARRGGIYDVAKVFDFGLVYAIQAAASQTPRTLDRAITGTPSYMSPEQGMGKTEPDAHSDIYSLGAVAYYLLTGAPPFACKTPARTISAHVHRPLVPPSRLRKEIPLDLEAVIVRCLAKAPSDRFQDVLALRDALSECAAAAGWNQGDADYWWQSNGNGETQAPVMSSTAMQDELTSLY